MSFSLCIISTVHAEEEPTKQETPSPLQGQVELGYQKHAGNTDTESINVNISAEYTEGRHRTTGKWEFYRLDKYGGEYRRKSTYTLQTDYKISPKGYLYGSFNGIDSRYSAYFKDYTFSAGYGYQLLNTDQITVELEMGPGYRYQEPNLDEIDDDDLIFPETVKEPIARGNARIAWSLTKTVTLESDFTIVSGESNTMTTTNVSLTNDITQNLALKLDYTRSYHSRVPDSLSKTDSATSINVVYHF
ncbi:hypothetical protein VIM7927_02692 [Vibrio mangrovi]|nr:hypothetical protein VIM7927_02692 [Vibrio mangrovi]